MVSDMHESNVKNAIKTNLEGLLICTILIFTFIIIFWNSILSFIQSFIEQMLVDITQLLYKLMKDIIMPFSVLIYGLFVLTFLIKLLNQAYPIEYDKSVKKPRNRDTGRFEPFIV
ncbi:MAG: hypothetical protein ACFE9L_17555 [Candidatus Hodarchaeota archaeon]